MENTTTIKRSTDGLTIQIISIGVAALLTGILATWLWTVLLHWTAGGGTVLKLLTWLLLAVVWGGASLKLWFNWNIKHYEIAQDALLVRTKAGWLGSTQTVYRYESIISIRMTQGFLGKRFGFGDVRIAIPKLDHEVVLSDIENPIQQLAEIQKRLNERAQGSNTTALIS